MAAEANSLKQNAYQAAKRELHDQDVQEQKSTPALAKTQQRGKFGKAADKPRVKEVKVLDRKKTVKDTKGDTWEVVDKREKTTIQKVVGSDSDSGSELSYDD